VDLFGATASVPCSGRMRAKDVVHREPFHWRVLTPRLSLLNSPEESVNPRMLLRSSATRLCREARC
jgi:hypothetical protein